MLLRFPPYPHHIFSDVLGSRESRAMLKFIFKLRKNEEKLNHKLFLSEVFARDVRLVNILCPHWSINKKPQCCLDREKQGQKQFLS